MMCQQKYYKYFITGPVILLGPVFLKLVSLPPNIIYISQDNKFLLDPFKTEI